MRQRCRRGGWSCASRRARGAAGVPAARSPDGAGRRAARRRLRQRLEGDEPGGDDPRARGVLARCPSDPGRIAEGRRLRAARACRGDGAGLGDLPDRRGRRRDRPCARRRRASALAATTVSRLLWLPRPRRRGRAIRCCCRRPARRSTSSATSRTVATRSVRSSRSSPREPRAAPAPAGHARRAGARDRHDRARRVRSGDGVLGVERLRPRRARQLALLPRARGRLRRSRAAGTGRVRSDRLPRDRQDLRRARAGIRGCCS